MVWIYQQSFETVNEGTSYFDIGRFVQMEDRKRALVSRLLQYALAHQVLAIPFHEIIINRTLEGKPYLVWLHSSVLVLSDRNWFWWRSEYVLPSRVSISILFIVLWICIMSFCFQECGHACVDFPNFNFNASHHGDYVAIASEPLCLVGVDIVSVVIPQKETPIEFVKNFSSCFSSFEWDNILNAGTSDDILTEFYRYP